MRSALLAIALAPLLAGCPALDVMEGKESPAKIEHERRLALVMPEPVAPPAEPDPVVEPEIMAASEPDPAPIEPELCAPVFRVVSCGEDGQEEWG